MANSDARHRLVPPPPLPHFYMPVGAGDEPTPATKVRVKSHHHTQAAPSVLSPVVDGTYNDVTRPGAQMLQVAPPQHFMQPVLFGRPTPHQEVDYVPPLAIYHICRICLRPRSPRYHQEHPIPINGVPPPPGICQRCRVISVEDRASVEERNRYVELVRQCESGDVKLGIKCLVPDEDIVTNEEWRKIQAEKLLRDTAWSRERRAARSQSRSRSRNSIVYRYVEGIDKPAEDRPPSRQTTSSESTQENVPEGYDESRRSPQSLRRAATPSLVVEPTENPPQFDRKAYRRVGATNFESLGKSQSAQNPSPTLRSRTTAAQTEVGRQRSEGADWTENDIRRIAREEVVTHTKSGEVRAATDSIIRGIAREEIQRYRAAERRLDTHPKAFKYGTLVPIEGSQVLHGTLSSQSPPKLAEGFKQSTRSSRKVTVEDDIDEHSVSKTNGPEKQRSEQSTIRVSATGRSQGVQVNERSTDSQSIRRPATASIRTGNSKVQEVVQVGAPKEPMSSPVDYTPKNHHTQANNRCGRPVEDAGMIFDRRGGVRTDTMILRLSEDAPKAETSLSQRWRTPGSGENPKPAVEQERQKTSSGTSRQHQRGPPEADISGTSLDGSGPRRNEVDSSRTRIVYPGDDTTEPSWRSASDNDSPSARAESRVRTISDQASKQSIRSSPGERFPDTRPRRVHQLDDTGVAISEAPTAQGSHNSSRAPRSENPGGDRQSWARKTTSLYSQSQVPTASRTRETQSTSHADDLPGGEHSKRRSSRRAALEDDVVRGSTRASQQRSDSTRRPHRIEEEVIELVEWIPARSQARSSVHREHDDGPSGASTRSGVDFEYTIKQTWIDPVGKPQSERLEDKGFIARSSRTGREWSSGRHEPQDTIARGRDRRMRKESVEGDESSHVRFSSKLHISPTPPDSDASSTAFRSFHSSGRGTTQDMATRRGYRRKETAERRPRSRERGQGGDRERAPGRRTAGTDDPHRLQEIRRSGSLDDALSESPSREAYMSGALPDDGHGPYRDPEWTHSLETQAGSPRSGSRKGQKRRDPTGASDRSRRW